MITKEEKEEIVSTYPFIWINGKRVQVAIRGLRLPFPEIVYRGQGFPLSWKLAKEIALEGKEVKWVEKE